MPIDLTALSFSDLKAMKEELKESLQNTRRNILVAETEEATLHFEELEATYRNLYNLVQTEINNRLN